MNKQTLYIILIIALFNYLLINIFRLQRDITNIRDKTDKLKKLSSKPRGNIKPNNNNNQLNTRNSIICQLIIPTINNHILIIK